MKHRIAVLIPCLNEVLTIFDVVRGYKQFLPDASIYVYDNGSTDETIVLAQGAGAIVRRCLNIGKGNVVSSMFLEVEADVYILVDGDGTYCPSYAKSLVNGVTQGGADMVVGTRLCKVANPTRPGFSDSHFWGNKLITFFINSLFGGNYTDVLSGYRAFSRKFVKTTIITSKAFEVESELSIQCLRLGSKWVEIPTSYGVRPPGSKSKLKTFKDGFLIIIYILKRFLQGV